MFTYSSFLQECITPYHTASYLKALFTGKNFKEYNISDKTTPGKYFFINKTLILAFTIPQKPHSFKIIGAHSDSPVLKAKPNPVFRQQDTLLLNLKTYGGGLFHTFFDRPLTLAGLIIKNNQESLIRIKDAVYIPSLAPHSAPEIYKTGFIFDKETHLKGIILKKEIESIFENVSHDLSLVEDRILESEDFFVSGRQDNLSSCFSAVNAILEAENSDFINMVAIFDNEEIGSTTFSGAKSNLFYFLVNKLASDMNICSFKNSFFISADAGHCDHPNYLERADFHHPVKFKEGPVLKYGSGYATDIYGDSLIKSLGKCQVMCVKNGVPCGSTIGSMVCVGLGIPSVDIGIPLLGMHSCTEIAAKEDINALTELMINFFRRKE